MRLGIDLDELLAGFMAALIDYHNATYDTALRREDFHSTRFWETWGGTREQAIQKIHDFHSTSYFRCMEPILGSQSGVYRLRENNDLFIITARQDCIADATRKWVDRHFPDTFLDVVFGNHFSQSGKSRTKRQICDSLEIDVLIDDCLEYALDCCTPSRHILLLDCPWNRCAGLPDGVYRVKSWDGIVDSFERMYVVSSIAVRKY